MFPETGTIQNQANPILKQALDVSGWVGFNTQAEAKAFAQGNAISKVKTVTKDVTNPDFSLIFKDVAPWFVRGLKVAFGGILIILGISRLTGMSNQVTQLASKVPVIPV